MPDKESFREEARQAFEQAFGPPQEFPTESGSIYRWVLPRITGPHGYIYVTIDSPELPSVAHVLLSDPSSGAVEPLAALTLRTIPEVTALVERIMAQAGPSR